ncbi:S-layer homology domain-containing protein [Lysinibacillus sp. LZ02]|uniref:S-layer homology domain-containing protein n=1 Tax=Lysinibacillus sp. LZ02 TaxID=3420668 RepID=UPI003D362907
MEKKKLQKLNKAVVATVLAASGITVTAPVVPTKASTIFKDLDPNADYYKPVIELINRGYISGFQDGTFRPHQAITRGESAKMLALALNLNITNPKNPGFRDVSDTHGYYKYIAALANEGIIKGYSDKTFRPNESINRNQMAKIIALGYEFQLSNKLTHDFKDVSESNANRFYIQTLYDLGITKGTTGITFSPYGLVTRGQLSTFILRAENTSAEKVKPIKEISHIEGSYVYINGMKYRVDASLRDIINDKNAAALKGAHIDGKIVGETLKTISTLTLNAQGKEGRHLIFDGNNSTFSAQLIVQGNYIQFRNWTLTGPVTIAETPRRTLSDFANPWQNRRVASITGFGFIDWEKPTDTTEEDDDPTYNGGGNDLTEKPSINPGDKVVERMPVIEKYVDFSNCSLRRLVMEANRTHVVSKNKLPHVTVQGWVRQFEIYAQIDTLYIEPDVATTMYGVGDIGTIYKNSYKDVFFNSDSHVNLMVVDNSSGWIDLGDHFYVDKIIIPPNKLPNDIFNDFVQDDDNIGDLEDSNGEDVDQDPDGEIIVPDWEAPTAEIVKIDVQGSAMTATIKSSEDGYYYYTIRKADDRIPTIREIVEEAQTTTLKTSGIGWVDEDINKTITASGLDENEEYVLYLVTKDEADNFSDKVSKSFTTKDGTPPRITFLDVTPLPGGKRATVSFTATERGRYYYRLVPKTGVTDPPTVEDVINSSGSLSGNGTAVEGSNTIKIDGLTHLTEYTIYMVMIDETGNETEDVISDTFTTRELDDILPTVSPDIKIVGSTAAEPTVIQLTFSEMMDQETAEKVENYILSGTGNLTGNPYSAKLESDGRTVTLLIPSMAAFVNNDTLIVTVQNVTDIAGNAILKGASTSIAKYTHQSDTKPVIESLEANSLGINNGNETIETQFSTKLTGTYYYMIVPVTPTDSNPPENIFKEPVISEVVFPQDYKLPVGSSAEKLNVNNYPQGTPVLLNNQTILYGKGTANDLTNSFQLLHPKLELDKNKTGYKIYMVLQDRNGNYSAIKEADYIKDSEKPQIVKDESYFVNPNDASASYKNFFYRDNFVPNESEIFEFRIKFSEPMDPASLTNRLNYKLEGLAAEFLEVTSVMMGSDSSTAVVRIKTKNAHAFSEYLLKEDYDLSIKVDGVLDFNKLQPVNDQISFTYIDKIKPILQPNGEGIKALRDYSISLSNDDLYIKLTFRENIGTFDESDFTISSSAGKAYTVADVVYAKDEKNKDIKSELILKVEGSTLTQDEDLTITVGNGVKDTYGNTMYIADNQYNQAIYKYRNITATINGTELDSSNVTSTGGIKSSRTAYILTTVTNMGPRAKYYFTVRPVTAAKPTTIHDIMNSDSTNSSAYGATEVQTPGTRQLLDAVLTSGNPNAVFVEGYVLYLIVIDEYNNVSDITEKVILPPTTTP